MMILTGDELSTILGGAAAATKSSSGSPDAQSALGRAAQQKSGTGSLDVFGYGQSDGSAGIGVEARQRLTPSISIFGQGKVGVKDNKPDDSVMGGIRFEW
ncbi:MAG: hypothetical protein ABI591_02620 [Kofleriaceae bacterium]